MSSLFKFVNKFQINELGEVIIDEKLEKETSITSPKLQILNEKEKKVEQIKDQHDVMVINLAPTVEKLVLEEKSCLEIQNLENEENLTEIVTPNEPNLQVIEKDIIVKEENFVNIKFLDENQSPKKEQIDEKEEQDKIEKEEKEKLIQHEKGKEIQQKDLNLSIIIINENIQQENNDHNNEIEKIQKENEKILSDLVKEEDEWKILSRTSSIDSNKSIQSPISSPSFTLEGDHLILSPRTSKIKDRIMSFQKMTSEKVESPKRSLSFVSQKDISKDLERRNSFSSQNNCDITPSSPSVSRVHNYYLTNVSPRIQNLRRIYEKEKK